MSSRTNRPADEQLPSFGPPPRAAQRAQALAQGGIVMGCDAPPPDADEIPLTLPANVVGWAYSRRGIDHVIVAIDGVAISSRYGLPRPDVVNALAEDDALHCGFLASVDPSSCDPGGHELAVVAVTRDGDAVGVRSTFVAERAETGRPEERLDNEGERYVPELYRGTYTEAEHVARYDWVGGLADGHVVLDAACGVGWGTAVLAHAGARRVIGVDIDEASLASGRERAGGLAEFVRGDLLALPFEDAAFDLVVCFEAIEHVSDPDRALDELRRVLSPDGLLAVSSPNRGVYPPGNPHHLRELTSEELETLLRQRFAHVALYGQQTHLGSLLSDERGLLATEELPARVHKMYAVSPGEELYAVALASDHELPTMDTVAVLGAPLDTSQFTDRIEVLEADLALTQAKLGSLAGELRQAESRATEAEDARARAERQVEEITRSGWWRATAPLRVATRATFDRRRHDRDDA